VVTFLYHNLHARIITILTESLDAKVWLMVYCGVKRQLVYMAGRCEYAEYTDTEANKLWSSSLLIWGRVILGISSSKLRLSWISHYRPAQALRTPGF
jgi:hypothetical protein